MGDSGRDYVGDSQKRLTKHSTLLAYYVHCPKFRIVTSNQPEVNV